ncbi:Pentatricopeptide repeat-containing protein [Apostasia shenzhenica]|uniref:Pentatricopeptide repeat-containing protein n=1 Tax=Apostasia shenzhenica TaxID=1088818 RepID=A0A2I0AKW8_9ASPA|nr:Pentatricopeptide repeat-containing protein [Apostasia shenzhenica]
MALPPPASTSSLFHLSPSPNRLLLPARISDLRNPNFGNPSFIRYRGCSARYLGSKPLASVRFSRLLMSGAQEAIGMGFFEAIKELERMVRDPSDVLAEMTERLSARELQLILVYFAQEGRDSYCALEVFDWLRRENLVDGETMQLMVSIVCGWIERIIGRDHEVDDVVGLLNEMDCVGLEPDFSMVEKVVSLYWEMGKKEEAVVFVKDVMRRRGVGASVVKDSGENGRGGPIGYLAWKMMMDGNYVRAVRLVIEFKENCLQPEVYSYLIALTALVKEQKELSKALWRVKASIKAGMADELDKESIRQIDRYQSNLIRDAVRLSEWAIQEGNSRISVLVHERLLAIYTCAGRGLEAEHQLWNIKLLGKEPDRKLYDAVLATCASQNEVGAVRRLLAGIEARGLEHRKKSLSWLLRGYLKGGYYLDASETLMNMLDLGLSPQYLDKVAVLQGLRKLIQESGNFEPYVKLCRYLSDRNLIVPCLVYMYINSYRLWIVKML